MEPYTADGLARREAADNKQEDSMVTEQPSSLSMATTYDLVGIAVHSGQANAGHYYSFIKDRRLVVFKYVNCDAL